MLFIGITNHFGEAAKINGICNSHLYGNFFFIKEVYLWLIMVCMQGTGKEC